MAIFHLHAQIMGKASGQSAVAASAYRHCAKMENLRTAQAYDYTAKRGNVHSEISIPKDAPIWAKTLASLDHHKASEIFWNRVESFENRSDAQFAREMTLALPVELTREENIALVRDFVAENFTAKGIVSDWAYHDIKGNPHAHVMTALRPLSEDGFGPKNTVLLDDDGKPVITKSGKAKYRQFAGGPELIPSLRSSWAQHQNLHLAQNGHDVQVDHRSYKDQGIELEATMHRGPTADGMDKRGAPSDRIEVNETIEVKRRDQIMADPSLVLKIITAQKAVFDERDVAKVVHRYTDNHADFQALFLRVGVLEDQVQIAPPLFDPITDKMIERAKYTTREVLETERALIFDTRSLGKSGGFAADEKTVSHAMREVQKSNGFAFDPEQSNVVRELVGDAAIAVMVGYAGAGKSTVMGAVRHIYEGEGRRVVGGALAGKAAVGLRDSAGIESRTLASWEASWKAGLRNLSKGDVFVLDEAGMVSSSQMQRFVEHVKLSGAKLIVLGDARQLQPIEYGAAFRAMSDNVGYSVLSGVRRQRDDFMREASVAFGSGRYQEGLQAYIDRGHVHIEADLSAARSKIIQAWFGDWSAGADVLMLAHRNKDVYALNEEARAAIKANGGLLDEVSFKAVRGERKIAVGERIVFLEKSRDLGVENGTFATVLSLGKGVIEAEIGDGKRVRFSDYEYANIDYGYTATIHKTQGATVDKAYVLGSNTLDAQLAYVALTRHRDDVQVYVSAGDFRNHEALVSALSRERLQSTTLALEQTDDYRQSVREFAERRGIPTVETLAEWWSCKVETLRGYFEKVVARFEAFSTQFGQAQPAAYSAKAVASVLSPAVESVVAAPAQLQFPEMTVGVQQSLNRLDTRRDHAELVNTDRARKSWFTAISFELTAGSSSKDLRAFNDQIREIVPRMEILRIGPDRDLASEDGVVLKLPSEIRERVLEQWPLIFSGQKAEFDQMQIEVAQAVLADAKERGIEQDYERSVAMFRKPDFNLVDPVVDWSQSIEDVVVMRIKADPSFISATGALTKVAKSIWKNPETVVARIAEVLGGGREALASRLRQVVETPGSLGELAGSRSLLGRNDAARDAALSLVRSVAAAADDLGTVYRNLYTSIRSDETAFRDAMKEAIPALSPAAAAFGKRIVSSSDKDIGQLVRNADDHRALAELRELVHEFRNRFGSRHGDELDTDKLERAGSVLDKQSLQTAVAVYREAHAASGRATALERAQGHNHEHVQQQGLHRENPAGFSY